MTRMLKNSECRYLKCYRLQENNVFSEVEESMHWVIYSDSKKDSVMAEVIVYFAALGLFQRGKKWKKCS